MMISYRETSNLPTYLSGIWTYLHSSNGFQELHPYSFVNNDNLHMPPTLCIIFLSYCCCRVSWLDNMTGIYIWVYIIIGMGPWGVLRYHTILHYLWVQAFILCQEKPYFNDAKFRIMKNDSNLRRHININFLSQTMEKSLHGIRFSISPFPFSSISWIFPIKFIMIYLTLKAMF